MIKTAAGIVTYNPDIQRLKANIDAITNQVYIVYCFDNGSDNINEIRRLLDAYDNVQLIGNEKNRGIAEGLNQILKVARTMHIEWLLTLDQDSVCPDGMISEMLSHSGGDNIIAICPLIVDRRRPVKERPKESNEYVDFCITSGCLVNMALSEKIGDFDAWLFIGQVDDEFCHRITLNGLRILRINKLVLDHELGDITPSKHKAFYLNLGTALHSKKLLALSYKRKVSPMRVYYSTRNMVYLSKKYKRFPNRKFTKKRAICNALSNVIRGQKKIEVAKAAIKGYKEGQHLPVKVYERKRI